MEQNNIEKQFNDEEDSGFDIMEWILYFLHFWYLFVIGIIISIQTILFTFNVSFQVFIK